MRKLLIAATLCAAATAAQAQAPLQSGNTAIIGCAESLDSGVGNPANYMAAGFCMGVLNVLDGKYGKFFGICSPDNATHAEATRVVLQWLRRNPQWLHEDFTDLAIVALRHVWPCSGSNPGEVSAPVRPR